MKNPFTSEPRRDDERWWENPDRPCADRPEYADPSLIRPTADRPKSKVMRDLASLCYECPVLSQCAAEMLTFPAGTAHGIRAGKIRL